MLLQAASPETLIPATRLVSPNKLGEPESPVPHRHACATASSNLSFYANPLARMMRSVAKASVIDSQSLSKGCRGVPNNPRKPPVAPRRVDGFVPARQMNSSGAREQEVVSDTGLFELKLGGQIASA